MSLKYYKEQFMIVRSYFPSAEEIDIDTQLQSLAIEISTMQRFLDFISLLAYTLETEKTKPTKQLVELSKVFKSADLPTLIKEFNANHFAMLVALNEKVQNDLEIRLYYVATEIADRLGGTNFVLNLNIALQSNIKTGYAHPVFLKSFLNIFYNYLFPSSLKLNLILSLTSFISVGIFDNAFLACAELYPKPTKASIVSV